MNLETLTVEQIERIHLRLEGIVQGVGFRPFVHRLAIELGLAGHVNNSVGGVTIEIEGGREAIDSFLSRIRVELPPIASIDHLDFKNVPLRNETHFRILESNRDGDSKAIIPADIAVCNDCLHELFDSSDRRYRYPFINCTNCGPRFTIVNELPYDRSKTTMACFEMCEACSSEYQDPTDRRFHAQPNACPVCGPSLWLHDGTNIVEDVDPIEEAIAALRRGHIVALRGLGGFHLAVDAANERAVRRLRDRKKRPSRPFALMVDSIDSAAELCDLNDHERKLLTDPRAPIVLLRCKAEAFIAPSVSIDNNYYGIMLCYTPLHHLLIRDNFKALVMTSGNLSDEPIAIGNEEALERLSGIADLFVLHDRDILQRADDSILASYNGIEVPIRRSRGIIPKAVKLPIESKTNILTCGADLKSCAAIVRGSNVYTTQHIGDLDHLSALEFYEHAINHMKKVLEVEPDLVAVDLHPDYHSTRYGLRHESQRVIRVQHHHAHLASVMADNQVTTPVVGVILDGTGYGPDDTIWGGEILVGDAYGFDREAWLEPMAMPGGDIAAREPWRMAAAVLHRLSVPLELWQNYLRIDRQNLTLVHQMLSNRFNSPETSSCGRLFDAAAGLLGLTERMEYEAQAAIKLEAAAQRYQVGVELKANEHVGSFEQKAIPTTDLFRSLIDDIRSQKSVDEIAAAFHVSVAQVLVNTTIQIARRRKIGQVGLSGGVWQNRVLFGLVYNALNRAGLTVVCHRQAPCNDGGVALGQAFIAASVDANRGEQPCVWQYPVG